MVIKDREYAYGGHDQHGMTGVYFTKYVAFVPTYLPSLVIPAKRLQTRLRTSRRYLPNSDLTRLLLPTRGGAQRNHHGGLSPPQSVGASIFNSEQASHRFQGTSYNLLTKNCNHFTSYLCEKLTGRPAPSWLNRAASIGVALPCVVPREWIAPPDHDTADGELLDEEDFEDERSSMLRSEQRRRQQRPSQDEQENWDSEMDRISSSGSGGSGGHRYGAARHGAPRLVTIKDTGGREMPPAERAPLPRRIT